MAIVLEEVPQVEVEETVPVVEAVDWNVAAFQAVRDLIDRQDTFTVDQVWSLLDERGVPAPKNRALLASVIEKAAKQGLCERTEQRVGSKRPEARGRKVAVWRRRGGSVEVLHAIRTICDQRYAFTVDHVVATLVSRGLTMHTRESIAPFLEEARRKGWCQKSLENVISRVDGKQLLVWKSAPLTSWLG